MKVEDRLLKMGQLWKDKKDQKQKAINSEVVDRGATTFEPCEKRG